MTTEKLPPKILIVEGYPSGKPFRYAVLIGVQDGIPAYCPESKEPPPDRLATDMERAMGMIGKALEPEPGNLDKNA